MVDGSGISVSDERDRLRRRLADQAMALELLAALPMADTPAAAVDVLLDIIEELCAPSAVGFFPADDPDGGVYRPARQRGRHVVDHVRNALVPGERWALMADGLALELAPDVGVLAAAQVAFPGYLTDYLNLLVTISGAVATALREVQAKSALTEQEQRFRGLAERSADIVFSVADDPSPHLTYANPRLQELTGWTPASLAEQPDLFRDMFAPHGTERGAQPGAQHSLTGFSMRYDVTIPCADGLTRIFEVTRVTIPGGAQGTAQDVTAERELQSHLVHRADTDSLTGLANRSHVQQQLAELLAEARATDNEVEFAYLDLDGFKAINDTYGHAAGDLVLVATAQRLSTAVSPIELVGRMGGDEFVVAQMLAPGIESDLVARIQIGLGVPLTIGQGVLVRADPSVGSVRVGVGDAAYRTLDVDAVLAAADRAMYEEKRRRNEAAANAGSAHMPPAHELSAHELSGQSHPHVLAALAHADLPPAAVRQSDGTVPAPSAVGSSPLVASYPVVVSAFEEAPVAMVLVGTGSTPGDLAVLAWNRVLVEFLGLAWSHDTRPAEQFTAVAGWLADDLQALPTFAAWESANRLVEVSFHHQSGDLKWGAVGLMRLDVAIADAYGVADVFARAVERAQDVWLLHVRDVTDQHSAEAQLAHRSTHEAVTGLPNRALLLSHLSEQLQADRAVEQRTGLIVLDLDDFRSVNNSLGVTGGDSYLQGVAEVLGSLCGPDDLLAHLGSDEFAMIVARVPDESAVAAVAETIRARLAAGVLVDGHVISAAASLGVAVSRRRANPATLLAEADGAMHLAKRGGGNKWAFAVRSWHRDAARVVTIEADLRQAIAHGGFELRYQPIFELSPGSALVEVEALVRWEHPRLGQMLPGDFIEVAERRNLMPELGLWILRHACAQAADWRKRLGERAPAVAVNVSSKQLETGDFATAVAHARQEHGLGPEHILLELTESQILTANEVVSSQLQVLAESGVRIAVDDFGTGQAGFQYLRRLPASVLKIDKSFIDRICTDDTDRAILHSVIGLGGSLGLTVIAEGVESCAQLELLRELGCDQAQGWLWRPALRPGDVEAIIGVPEDQLRHNTGAPVTQAGHHPTGVPGRT